MNAKSLSKIAFFAFLSTTTSWTMANSSVEGLWKTQDGRAKVDIKPCKTGSSTLCGKIIELREPLDPKTGREKTDGFNPEDKLKSRKLMGMITLWDFKAVPDEPNHWSDGKIYSPREGKTYSSEMDVTEDGKTLTVRGYVGLPIFGQSQVWTRTTPDEKLMATQE
ncbi:MAG: DUF2147 domain-containing protein [Janthinobacterium lividum]